MSPDHFSSDLSPTSQGPVPIIYLMEHRKSLSTSRKDLVKARYAIPFSCTEPHIHNFRSENIALHFIMFIDYLNILFYVFIFKTLVQLGFVILVLV